MNNGQEIVYLNNQEIDYNKWDFCVRNAGNGNLYAKSWFLDVVSPGWKALVFGNYEYVMPLPVKKKLGIQVVTQPLHCQQLGIFPAPAPEIQQKFGNRLIGIFNVVRYQLNSAMDERAFLKFKLQKKTNYVLPLNHSYKTISNFYSNHAQRNLKAAKKADVKVIKGLLPTEFFGSKKQAVKRDVPKNSYQILNFLMARTITSGAGTIYAAYSKSNNLCAAAFIVIDQNKAYYLNAFSTDEGRENRAMYAIVDKLVQEYCNAEMEIDFEGSVIEGVARFYEGFGALSENYYFINSNKMPFLLKNIF